VPEGYNFITIDLPGLPLDTLYGWEFMEKLTKLINENRLNILLDPLKVKDLPYDILKTSQSRSTYKEIKNLENFESNEFLRNEYIIRHHYSGQKFIDHELNFLNKKGIVNKMQISGIFNLFNIDKTKNTMIDKLYLSTEITEYYENHQLSKEQHLMANNLVNLIGIPIINAQEIIIYNNITNYDIYNNYIKSIDNVIKDNIFIKELIKKKKIIEEVQYKLLKENNISYDMDSLEYAMNFYKLDSDKLYDLFINLNKLAKLPKTFNEEQKKKFNKIKLQITNRGINIFKNNKSTIMEKYFIYNDKKPSNIRTNSINLLIPENATINYKYHEFPRNQLLKQLILDENKYKFLLSELIEKKILLPGTYFLGFCRTFQEYYYENPKIAKLIRQKSIDLYNKKPNCNEIPCNNSSAWDNDCSNYDDCNKCIKIDSNISRCSLNLK
jgi:hypothetical protein